MRDGVWLALAMLVALPGQAAATSISPVNIEMTTTGTQARAQIVISNSSDRAMAVEPEVRTTEMDEAGKVRHEAAGDEFLILPAQALIAPGASQVFRVQWMGEPELAQSKSYLIAMNELPLKGMGKGTELGVTLSFGVAVNVAATNVAPSLTVVASGVKKDKAGHPRPYVILENATAGHALLRNARLTLLSRNWSTVIAPGAFEQVLGTGLVQPFHRREFILPVNLPPTVSSVEASISLQP